MQVVLLTLLVATFSGAFAAPVEDSHAVIARAPIDNSTGTTPPKLHLLTNTSRSRGSLVHQDNNHWVHENPG
jgi:hypothetical protein